MKALLQDTEEQCDGLKNRVSKVREARAHVETEMGTTKQRALEVQEALEQNVATRRRVLNDERERMEKELAHERKVSEELKEELEREREANAAMLSRAQDENRAKLEVVGREKARVEETCKSDMASRRDTLNQQQRQVDMLEHHLARVRSLLQESEANLSWVHQEFEREDHEASNAVRQLTEATRSLQAALDKSIRDETSLSRRIGDATQSIEDERKRLLKELDEVRHSTAVEQAELESRVQRAKSELELELRGRRERERERDRDRNRSMAYRASDVERARDESLDQDTCHLQGSLQGSYSQSRENALPTTHTRYVARELENRIQRLQRYTEELRSSFLGGAADLPASAILNTSCSGDRSNTWDAPPLSPVPRQSKGGGFGGISSQPLPRGATELFDQVDLDHDGVISRDEFRHAFQPPLAGTRLGTSPVR